MSSSPLMGPCSGMATVTQSILLSIFPLNSLVNMSLCCIVLVSLLFYECFNLEAPGHVFTKILILRIILKNFLRIVVFLEKF